MEKFKDFLYNKNDIVVAIIILLIALTIIAFRVKDIMQYPKELAEQQSQAIQKIEQSDDDSQNGTETDKDNSSSKDSSKKSE